MTDLLHHTGWLLPIVDIVVVAAVIYRLLLMLKETTAVRILLAVPLVLLAYMLAQVCGLVTMRWLLDNFLASFIIILVIIFQYDIRRALLSLSRRRASIDDEPKSDEAHAVIDELVSAAESLADRNIGALMVIEREMPLENFMQVGTEIDAKVTSELISSIFLPYSPIHDGAVIVQRGKLTKAGCFLPLTQNPDVAKDLGTRHRAAIGITEIVDAVVIVVSEERGVVSIVVGGKINSNLDGVGLHKILRRLLDVRWLQ